jgi:peptidyl-prolyl cis-trans isomerase B (cyclophilin B)
MRVVFQLMFNLGLALTACGGSSTKDVSPAKQGTAADNAVKIEAPLELILNLESSRIYDSRLAYLAASNQSHLRSATAKAVGRIGDPRGAALISRLLSDPNPVVRKAAGFASFELLRQNPKRLPDLISSLKKRLTEEKNEETLTSVLNAVSQSRDASQISSIDRFLEDDRVSVRAAAIRSMAELGRLFPIPKSSLLKITEGLSQEPDSVRLAAATCLGVTGGANRPASGTKEALLSAATQDRSSEVRIKAVAAAVKYGFLDQEFTSLLMADPDYRVGVSLLLGISTLEKGKRCPLIIKILESYLDPSNSAGGFVDDATIHKINGALDIALGCTNKEPFATLANQLLEKTIKANSSLSANTALTHCLLKDLAGHTDLEILACDPQRPETGKIALIRRIGRLNKPSEENIEILCQFLNDTSAEVNVEALFALAKTSPNTAARVIYEALEDKRSIVVSAALQAIALHPKSYRSWNGTSLVDALDRVVSRFETFEQVQTPILYAINALTEIDGSDAQNLLQRLTVDSRPAIRAAVLRAYNTIEGLDPPGGLPLVGVTNRLDTAERERWQRSKSSVLVRTTRGDFEIELDSKTSPEAVANFAGLAEDGFYDDTPIGKVRPGVSVHAGEPSGTGLGDSPRTLLSENSPKPIMRGTVIVDCALRDAGGAGFAIALARDPHLDGKHTVLGQVTSGMDTIDLLNRGDRITKVAVFLEEFNE